MYNHTLMQYEVEEALARSANYDPQLMVLLAELREEQGRPTLRSRIAGAIVGIALRLDPDAMAVARPQLALEGLHVRD